MGGEIKSSGNTYTVIRVSRIQSQQQSQPLQQEQSVMNNSKQQPAVEITSIDDSVSSSTTTTTNAEMQEEMYNRYGMELQHLADRGFENFAVLFPILKAITFMLSCTMYVLRTADYAAITSGAGVLL